MTTVFISHSAKGDADADKILHLVKEGLVAKNYTVVVDADVLKPGQNWASVLYQRLAECNAAVVLLSSKALNSSWVRREVNILLWRQALGAPLHIVPALIGGLRPQDVEQAGFTELEPLEFALDEVAAFREEHIAKQIIDQFADLPTTIQDKSPMCIWLKTIARCLKDVDEPSALEDAARYLSVDEEDVGQVRLPDGRTFLAHQFLSHQGHNESSPQRETVQAVVEIGRYIPLEWLRRLTAQISPTWIDGTAARSLLTFSKQANGVVVLNAYSVRTAKEYIKRAWCCAQTGYLAEEVAVQTGEALIDEFLHLCDKAVDNLIGTPPGAPRAEWVKKFLQKDPPKRDTCYLIVHPGGFDNNLANAAAAVRKARERYPWLTFILLTGETPASLDEIKRWHLDDALILPPLSDGDEHNGLQMVNGLLRVPENFIGGAA